MRWVTNTSVKEGIWVCDRVLILLVVVLIGLCPEEGKDVYILVRLTQGDFWVQGFMSFFLWVSDVMGCGGRTRWLRQSCDGSTRGVIMDNRGEMGEVESGDDSQVNP